MLNPINNVFKLRNSVLLGVFACLKMAIKIIQNLTLLLIHCLMYLRIFVGVLCWSLFCYTSLCVLSILLTP